MDNKSLLKISERFESLGHNCEIGFALRKLGNEDGQIFRWAVVPIRAIAKLIEERPDHIYKMESLRPCANDMVRDCDIGISFHTSFRFEKQADNSWKSLNTEKQDSILYARDAEKFQYMYEKFLKRLSAPGTIFVYKEPHQPNEVDIAYLAEAINSASCGRSALAVVYQDNTLPSPLAVEYPGKSLAIVKMRELVDNKDAETATYEHWHEMFRLLDEHFG